MQYTSTSWRVGPCTPVSLEETMVVEAAGVCGFMPTDAVKFKRLQLKECLLHSKQYTRSQKMNNYTISFKDDQTASIHAVVEKFGTIETFLDISNTDTGQHAVFAIVNEFTTKPLVCSGIILKHMLLATEARCRIIPVSWILNKCITVNRKRFVVKHGMYMSLSC